ncbi:hypothetical protein [Dyella sp.]|jgi:hypothetical protein|uniref:hypothetical protein n=1 Tax=Dyella sp. TaxID=1869338 RepID=UPI002D79BCC8|nr:hypothetical protein [Dyella sp.]HET6432777.1 hypothetical protein [Dyella sp.]
MSDRRAGPEPSAAGRRLWSGSDGWLDLSAADAAVPARLACTCQDGCLERECRGRCRCEACALAWLIREDERAVWNEAGELVPPEALDGPWRRVRDPSQLTLRFQFHRAETPHG